MTVDSAPLVLLVEADPDTRDMYVLAFEHQGFRTLQAASAADALAQCRDPVPDIVVMDVTLPGIDGFQLCARLREQFTPTQLPIVVVTGRYSGSEAIARARRAGCQNVLLKPCLPDTLIAEARRLIAHAQGMRARAASIRERAAAAIVNARQISQRTRGPKA